MNKTEAITGLMEEYNGIITTAQVLECGISKPTFYSYAEKNELKQISRGIYASKDCWIDGMYVLHLRCPQLIFSHDSSLFLHDLTDREPLEYSVTLKTGYNTTNLKNDGVQVYTVKKELCQAGLTEQLTSFGHSVPVYDMERTVCDVIRSRNSIEIQTVQNALKQYTMRKDKNLRLLMKYACMFHVEKIIRQYMEVLL